ncbi:cytochrome P450 [Crucibulum laeve]|uniref:Cytochrome P450 n=1 Tax=Crucibulum laeve TaxID=68775 RepID=A0A5C3LS90_9AGAR|nr:cytochrome P450 [Crucibulum laeve]
MLYPTLLFTALALFLKWIFTPPAKLRHLPRVSFFRVLWSYANKETEEARIRKLYIPFMQEKGEGVAISYALGRWLIHILDPKIWRTVADDAANWPKELPPSDMVFFRFVGTKNVVFSNGETWQKHSTVVHAALKRTLPIEQFTVLTQKLFKRMGDGGLIKWDHWTMRVALDAVGTTILGYDFEAVENDNSPFLKQYTTIMDALSIPLFLVFPIFDVWFPRKDLINNIDALIARFQAILDYKRENRGNDMLTYMLEEPSLTEEEYRHNMAAFFVAGHDSTAAALSTLVAYLAIYPAFQERARKEVIHALDNKDPDSHNLANMQFLYACVLEALRINTPFPFTAPRVSPTGATLHGSNGKSYYIPPNTSTVLSIASLHRNENNWSDAHTFNPERHLDTLTGKTKIDATIWVPFSRGPRQCPARNFAMYEMRTVTALLLQSWEWELPPGSPHAIAPQNVFSPFGLSSPKDLYINFTKRG